MTDSLFHEVYGSYFQITKMILDKGEALSKSQLEKIVHEFGFNETITQLLPPLTNQKNDWQLLAENEDGNFLPVIKNQTPYFQTTLEKRWLKTILSDERIHFFLDSEEINMLEKQLYDITPLFEVESVNYYDQFSNFESISTLKEQQTHFKRILTAIENNETINILYQKKTDARRREFTYLPFKIEYSLKNNLFRIKAWRILKNSRFEVVLNLNRILAISTNETIVTPLDLPISSSRKQKTVTCQIRNKRDSLKRSMLHFSDYYKTTQRLDDDLYEVTIHYDTNDETELLIRILSFGPFMKVISPESFVEKIVERIEMQESLIKNL